MYNKALKHVLATFQLCTAPTPPTCNRRRVHSRSESPFSFWGIRWKHEVSFSVFSSRFYKPDRRTVRGSFLFSFFIDVKNLQKHKKNKSWRREKAFWVQRRKARLLWTRIFYFLHCNCIKRSHNLSVCVWMWEFDRFSSPAISVARRLKPNVNISFGLF